MITDPGAASKSAIEESQWRFIKPTICTSLYFVEPRRRSLSLLPTLTIVRSDKATVGYCGTISINRPLWLHARCPIYLQLPERVSVRRVLAIQEIEWSVDSRLAYHTFTWDLSDIAVVLRASRKDNEEIPDVARSSVVMNIFDEPVRARLSRGDRIQKKRRLPIVTQGCLFVANRSCTCSPAVEMKARLIHIKNLLHPPNHSHTLSLFNSRRGLLPNQSPGASIYLPFSPIVGL